ncbi:MAG: hypothetical protein NT164_07160 [Verrucomicrobiae bacterium]|nr:hypothetical protein [Verrucomicrobiae bacterium]
MSAEIISPDLQAAVLCEDVRAEASGQQTLIGVLGAIPTSVVPIGFLKLCFWTRWCGGFGTFCQRTSIVDPDEQESIAETSLNFTLNHMHAHATNVHFFGRLQFQRFGVYHIEVYLDKQLRLRIPFPVIKVDPEKNNLILSKGA